MPPGWLSAFIHHLDELFHLIHLLAAPTCILLSLTGYTELKFHLIRPLVQGQDLLRDLDMLLMSGFQCNSNSIVSNEPASSIVGQCAFFFLATWFLERNIMLLQ